MAIQINEKNLSDEAVKALNNAKNKSQFLRDAIEFYVSRGNELKIIQNDIKYIKNKIACTNTNFVPDENEKNSIAKEISIADSEKQDSQQPEILNYNEVTDNYKQDDFKSENTNATKITESESKNNKSRYTNNKNSKDEKNEQIDPELEDDINKLIGGFTKIN